MDERFLIALGLSALIGCGSDHVESPVAVSVAAPGAPPAAAAQESAQESAPIASSDAEEAASAPPASQSGIHIRMDGNTIISRDGPSTDPFSVIEVEVTAPSPFELTVRVQPELAPDLANEMLETVGNAKGERSFAIKELDGPRLGASLKLNRTAFTIAGRPIDVAGGHLRVCDVEFGPLATGAVVTLKPGEVRVDDVFRGPLPAPVEAR